MIKILYKSSLFIFSLLLLKLVLAPAAMCDDPPDCFTPDHYTLWVYNEFGTYLENSNELADGSVDVHLRWDNYEENGIVTLWIFMAPDYNHPDLGWRPYLQPDGSYDEWGDCDYANDGQWVSNPTVSLNVWGDDELDIYPEFTGLGVYQITGTHPGWSCSSGQCGTTISGGADSITINLIGDSNLKKIPLGYSEELSKYCVGKVYVPTQYGGNLTLSGSDVELFYDGGSDLGLDKAILILRGEYNAYRVAQGNPCNYTVPMNDYGWYYVKIPNTSGQTIQNTFKQSKTVTKSPWSCSWYPMSDAQSPNLYDVDECLAKYDEAYGTSVLEKEKTNIFLDHVRGHFVNQNTIIESDAERSLGIDFDNADGDLDEWTGWDANVADDFLSGSGDSYSWGSDGDTVDSMDVSWWGHCYERTSVIIKENEPTGYYNAPNNVVFTPELKKGLLIALYHNNSELFREGNDVNANKWHYYLEKTILGDDLMVAADVYNSGIGADKKWNYPIYSINEAEYKEDIGSSNVNVIEITCNCKYWDSNNSSQNLFYKYKVEYSNGEVVLQSINCEWRLHPFSSENHRTPDTIWMPDDLESTNVLLYWSGRLDYSTVRTIVQ